MLTVSSSGSRALCFALMLAAISAPAWATEPSHSAPAEASANLDLAAYPSGGQPLTLAVRQIVVKDANRIDEVLNLAKSASLLQQSAMGAGLAQAVQVLVVDNPKLAAALQEKVARSGIDTLISSYMALTTETLTASIGAGGGGGGGTGPVGGIGSGATGPFTAGPNSTSFSVNNGSTGFQSFATPQFRTGGSTTVFTSSVSPTQ